MDREQRKALRAKYESARADFNQLLLDYEQAKGDRARKEIYDRTMANYEYLIYLMREMEGEDEK